MKILAFLFLSFFGAVTGSNDTNIDPVNTRIDDQSITVDLSDLTSDVAVTIEDAFGYNLLFEKLNPSDQKFRKYNLSQLPDGVYSLTLNTYNSFITKKISIKYSKTSLLEETISYKPTQRFEDNKWIVNLFAQGEDVSVKIFDDNTDIVYEETSRDQQVFSKAYNLENLSVGNYSIQLYVDGRSYFNDVEVK